MTYEVKYFSGAVVSAIEIKADGIVSNEDYVTLTKDNDGVVAVFEKIKFICVVKKLKSS